MKVGVARESAPGERRVALVPEALGKLTAAGLEILVERGAGSGRPGHRSRGVARPTPALERTRPATRSPPSGPHDGTRPRVSLAAISRTLDTPR